MSWLSLADATKAPRSLTPDEREAVNDALDAASEWDAGRLPFEEAIKTGTAVNGHGYVSPSWTRYLAIRTVEAADPRKQSLLRLLDVAIQMRGKVVTEQGVFERQHLSESDEHVARFRANGGEAVT